MQAKKTIEEVEKINVIDTWLKRFTSELLDTLLSSVFAMASSISLASKLGWKSNLFWGFMDSGDMSGYFGYFNSSRNRWTPLSGLGIWFLILSLDRLDREFLADWRSSS
ncbi:hypothetical protein Q3G72_032802 [Acer saccharum]|nr:hypothetical protein Q3G72_032802 [Acer saccharum]